MRTLIFRILTVAAALSLCLGCAGLQLVPGTNSVRSAAKELAVQLSENLPSGQKPVIAVLDFVGPHERYTALGNTMSEALTAQLFKTRRFEKIVERARMNDVLGQQRLEQSWHYDQAGVAELGKKIGAGAIVVGTVKQVGRTVELNARLINSETGEMLSVAETQIKARDDIKMLLQQDMTASLAITLVEDDGTGSFGNVRSRAYITVGSEQTREVAGGTAVIDSVPYGPHMLVVSAPGYETATDHVFISGDQSRMITLVAQQARLTLQLTPSNAVVLIDGIRAQASKEGIVTVTLKTGEHSLLVSSGEKYVPDDRRIELVSDKSMSIVLSKAGAKTRQDGETEKSPRYADLGNGIVRDAQTGLMWQQASAPGTYTWDKAKAYCAALTLGGYSDWRLPTKKELVSLIGKRGDPVTDVVDTHYFPDTQKSYYWSSTAKTGDAGAWGVHFDHGFVGYDNKNKPAYVRAVRR